MIIIIIAEYMRIRSNASNYEEIIKKSSITYMMKENPSFYVMFERLIETYILKLIIIVMYMYIWGEVFISLEQNNVKVSCIFKKLIIDYESVFLAFNGILITVIIFIATLGPKKYYIFFSKDEVLRKYKLGELFIKLIASSFVSTLIYFMLLSNIIKGELLLALIGINCGIVIFNWLISFFAIIRIWRIGFTNDKFELKILGNLNGIFNDNRKLNHIREGDEFALNQNLSFLLNDYQKLMKKRKIRKMDKCKNIIFNLTHENKKVLEHAKNRFYCFFVMVCFVSLGYLIYTKEENYIIIIDTVLSLLCLTSILYFWDNTYVSETIMSLIYPKFGYSIKIRDEIGDGERFVGYYEMWKKNIFDEYLLKYKKIMAFYCIVCNSMATEQSNEFIKVDVVDKLFEEALLALDENLIEENRWKDFMIKLPIITSSYFYYLKLKRLPISISLYMKNFTDEETMRMCSMMKAFITDVSRNRVLESSLGFVKMRYKSLEELEQDIIATGFFKILTKKEGLLL